MIVERHVDRREVLIHFLAIEEGGVPDEYANRSTTELEDVVRRLCFTHGINPFGIYLVGREADCRNERIADWVLGLIPSEGLYSCGVDNLWDPILREKRGNLTAVVTGYNSLPGLRSLQGLSEIQETIVTIKQLTNGKDGQFEVIDGFHRAIALMHKGRKRLRSYVGLVQEDLLGTGSK